MYKKKMKSIFAAALTVVMLSSQAVSAMAAEDYGADVLSEESEFVLVPSDEAEASDPEAIDQEAFEFELVEEPTEEEAAGEETAETSDEEISLGEAETSEEQEEGAFVTAQEEENYTAILSGIQGMPEEYELTAPEKSIKDSIIEADDYSEFLKLTEGEDYVEDRVMTLADNRAHAEMIANAYNGRLVSYSYGVALIDLSDSPVDVADAYLLASDPFTNIPAVVPNYINEVEDPVAAPQGARSGVLSTDINKSLITDWEKIYYDWGFDDPYLNPNSYDGNGEFGLYEFFQWHHEMIDTFSAWGVTTGDPSITVAVIDSGINFEHEDFDPGTDKVTEFSINTDPEKREACRTNHGSHVGGIVAASLNGKGGAGVAPDVKLFSVMANTRPIGGKVGEYTDADLVASINFVAGKDKDNNEVGRHADILNMSIGGPVPNPLIQEAINYAYKQGITVVVSMGNEHSNDKSYPACYEHVISVASVNEEGTRSWFSTYGPWCTIAAPGSNILSTYADAPDSYGLMDGTSMASPIVAGACALYMSVYGHVDPDEMTAVIKKSAVKTSETGIGAGIINLAKMFGGDSAAPTITEDNDNIYIEVNNFKVENSGDEKSEVEDKSNKQFNRGTSIIYTTNGSKPAAKNGKVTNGNVIAVEDLPGTIATISKSEITGLLSADKKFTVKAATLTGVGTLSKPATLTFKAIATNKEKKVTSITVTGQKTVVAGGSATYKASVLPSNAKVKKVDWSVTPATDGVTISRSGKLKVASTVAPGTFTITAAAKDSSGVTGTFEVNVSSTKTASVVLTPGSTDELYQIAYNKKKVLTSLKLFNVNIAGEGRELPENEITLSAKTLDKEGNDLSSATGLLWKSSNPKVVTVYGDGNTVTVKALNKGTATITCTAQDGSKKKASVKVSVTVPVSGISLSIKKGQSNNLATGSSVQFSVNYGDAYGAPSVKKVEWEAKPHIERSNINGGEYEDVTKLYPDIDKLFKLTSSGKLTAGKQSEYNKCRETLLSGDYSYDNGYRLGMYVDVYAYSQDGTGYYAAYGINLKQMCPVDFEIFFGDERVSSYTFEDPSTPYKIFALTTWYSFDGKVRDINLYDDINVHSSNPEVATGSLLRDDEGYLGLIVVPQKKGKTTLTLKAMDGSGKKCTFTIKVVNDPAK